jgi:glycosyltransferase involved in cell wall biosynthesis
MSALRWLIVEDALRDRTGHWFEYIRTFTQALARLGDPVTVLAERTAQPFIVEGLPAQPVLPASIWHRMSDGAPALTRYWRVPSHGWQTYRSVAHWLKGQLEQDVIFVPTVLVHHLLGWVALLKGPLARKHSRVILFFPSAPITAEPTTGAVAWDAAATARLFRQLLRLLKPEIRAGCVVLAAETEQMRTALAQLTGLPVRYAPHPVEPVFSGPSDPPEGGLVMASFGGARHEKGVDVLITAVDRYLARYPISRARFVLQNIGGQAADWRVLEGHPQVTLINRYFGEGEYATYLRATQVLLLPYRRSSYGLRVSRVAAEAMVNGIPMVITSGTTLASQAGQLGAAVFSEDGEVESLVEAIHQADVRYESLRQLALSRMPLAREHFSVRSFRQLLCQP